MLRTIGKNRHLKIVLEKNFIFCKKKKKEKKENFIDCNDFPDKPFFINYLFGKFDEIVGSLNAVRKLMESLSNQHLQWFFHSR